VLIRLIMQQRLNLCLIMALMDLLEVGITTLKLLVLVHMMLLLNTSDVLIILDMSLFVGKQPLKILLSILIKLELLCWIA
jgi:hypothetical protein